MKRAKADRILWDVGEWAWRRSGRRKPRLVWKSRELCNSRKAARFKRFQHESVRRCEIFYVD